MKLPILLLTLLVTSTAQAGVAYDSWLECMQVSIHSANETPTFTEAVQRQIQNQKDALRANDFEAAANAETQIRESLQSTTQLASGSCAQLAPIPLTAEHPAIPYDKNPKSATAPLPATDAICQSQVRHELLDTSPYRELRAELVTRLRKARAEGNDEAERSVGVLMGQLLKQVDAVGAKACPGAFGP